MRWYAGTVLAQSDRSAIIISVERRVEQEAFSGRELTLMESLFPHMRRACQLALHLGLAQGQGMLDAFDLMGCGGVLIDLLGRVIRLNAKAQAHLGHGITLAHGQVLASHGPSNAALQRLIASVLQTGPAHDAAARGAVALARRDRRPLIVHAAPVVGSAHDLFQRAKAILMLVDPDEHRTPAEPILRQAFGLTPAEVRVVLALLQGKDVGEIALAHAVTEGTVRVQLRSIFAKTDTKRQAELVALIGRMSLASSAR